MNLNKSAGWDFHRAQLAHVPNQSIRYREGSMAIEML